MTYTDEFLSNSKKIIDLLDREAIERIASELAAVRARGGRLFILGSGGGAGHASHAVNDFRKIAGIEAYAPTDNVSELTARINDEGWETSYSNWLRVSRIEASDAILIFSVGGGDAVRSISVNLVRCIDLAREVGATVLGIVGRDGGYTAAVGEAVVIAPVDRDTVTPQTEGLQAVIWHLLVSHPAVRQKPGKWESAT
ncbi:MAG: SIS domain-containing protein [Candidatus Limnocylindrales bacterium]